MKASFFACLVNILPMLVYSLLGIVLAIVATIPLGLGWLVLARCSRPASTRATRTSSALHWRRPAGGSPLAPLVRLLPVRADADVDDQRHGKLRDARHPQRQLRPSRARARAPAPRARARRGPAARASSRVRRVRIQSRTAIIASLTRSAAVPCIGALIAARSAPARRGPPAALMSGSHSRRPNTVST